MEQKIIFAGPVGAGKTTAIASISDIPVVSTERSATDDVAQRKASTTVAMDYGLIKLEDGIRVHLYGAPGQQRFSFMWDILTDGGIGLIIMLDHKRESIIEDLDLFLGAFQKFIRRVKGAVAIGVTRSDLLPDASIEPLREHVLARGLNIPIFQVDARDPEDVRHLLLALLSSLHPAVVRASCKMGGACRLTCSVCPLNAWEQPAKGAAN